MENEDLYKSVLNKIMTTHEQWIKCNCYDYRANNNAVTWQREKNFIILYSKKYTLKKCILINTFAFCRMLPSWSVFCHLTKVRRQQFRWWCQMMSVFFHFQPTINIFFNNCKWGGWGWWTLQLSQFISQTASRQFLQQLLFPCSGPRWPLH